MILVSIFDTFNSSLTITTFCNTGTYAPPCMTQNTLGTTLLDLCLLSYVGILSLYNTRNKNLNDRSILARLFFCFMSGHLDAHMILTLAHWIFLPLLIQT